MPEISHTLHPAKNLAPLTIPRTKSPLPTTRITTIHTRTYHDRSPRLIRRPILHNTAQQSRFNKIARSRVEGAAWAEGPQERRRDFI